MNSTKDLRDALYKQIDDLVNNKGDIKKAKVICDLSAQAIYSTRLEIENKRLELELGKADEEVKTWMKRDFSKIQEIKA